MPRRKPLTRSGLEMLLHGELLEGEVICHCPICGRYADDLEARAFGHLELVLNEDGDIWEVVEPGRLASSIIVKCTCGFVADEAFFDPDMSFPILEYDEEHDGRFVAAGTFELDVLQTDGKWTFVNSKAARVYYELLQIVNAEFIRELPTALVSDVEWLRNLAVTIFDKLKRKRAQSGLPRNPYR